MMLRCDGVFVCVVRGGSMCGLFVGVCVVVSCRLCRGVCRFGGAVLMCVVWFGLVCWCCVVCVCCWCVMVCFVVVC